jgi:hypothetical protein
VRDVFERAISLQADMELVQEHVTIVAPDTPAAPDVVIVGATNRDDQRNVSRVLMRWPQSQVLMITIEGHQAAIYQLRPQRNDLGEMSPIELFNAIRSCVQRNS